MQPQPLQYNKFFASSSDPTGATLSKSVEGVIIAASSLIVLLGLKVFHVMITADDVSSLATEVSTIIGGIVVIYGLFKKLVNSVGTV